MPLLGATAAEPRDFVEYYMKVTRAQMVDDLRAQLAEVSGRAADLMVELEGLRRRKSNKAHRHELARNAEQARSHAEALSFEIDRLRRECEPAPLFSSSSLVLTPPPDAFAAREGGMPPADLDLYEAVDDDALRAYALPRTGAGDDDGDDVAVADAAGGRDDGDEGRRSPSERSPLRKRPRRESAPGASARSGGPSPTRPLPAPSASAVVPTTSAAVLPAPAVVAPAPVAGPSTAVAGSVGDATPRGRPKLPRKAEKMLVAFQAPVSRRSSFVAVS